MSDKEKTRGYHGGGVDSVISVEEVNRQAAAIAEDISLEQLDELAGNDSYVSIRNLVAGYGQMEILHDLDLRVGKGAVPVPDWTQRRRQIHHPACNFRL